MPTALLAVLSLAVVAVVLTGARSAAILALDSYAVVLADARPTAFLAPASSAVVLAVSSRRCSTVAALAVLTTLALRAALAALVRSSIEPLFL
jgi:hypothetical protein